MIFHDLPLIDVFAIAAIMIGPLLLGNLLIERGFEKLGGALLVVHVLIWVLGFLLGVVILLVGIFS